MKNPENVLGMILSVILTLASNNASAVALTDITKIIKLGKHLELYE